MNGQDKKDLNVIFSDGEFDSIINWHVDLDEDENKSQNYYVNESVGIAVGFLISAIHKAGLVTLAHTPSPMKFLQKVLGRPKNEKAFLLLPVGYPSKDCIVPDLERKMLDEISFWF